MGLRLCGECKQFRDEAISMGSADSKEQRHLMLERECHRERLPEVAPWSVIYSTSTYKWPNVAPLYGFDPRINYSRRHEYEFLPWPTNGRCIRASLSHYNVPNNAMLDSEDELDEIELEEEEQELLELSLILFEKENDEIEWEIGLPKLVDLNGINVNIIEVIACRDEDVMIQITTGSGLVHFLMANLKNCSARVVYSHDFGNVPRLVFECAISPDRKYFLIKRNYHYQKDYSAGKKVDYLFLLSPPEQNAHSSSTPDRLVSSMLFNKIIEHDAVDSAYAFDPRFEHSRVAITFYDTKREQFNVALYDTDVMGFMVTTKLAHGERFITFSTDELRRRYVISVKYSPDGRFFAVAMATCHQDDFLPTYSRDLIRVFDSTNLQGLFDVKDNIQSTYEFLSPSMIFPLFSKEGDLLAVNSCIQCIDELALGNDQIRLHKTPTCVNLQFMCRQVLRRLVYPPDIVDLPLPRRLINYLMYKPIHV